MKGDLNAARHTYRTGDIEWSLWPDSEKGTADRDVQQFVAAAKLAGTGLLTRSDLPIGYKEMSPDDRWLSAVVRLVDRGTDFEGDGQDERGRYVTLFVDSIVDASKVACSILLAQADALAPGSVDPGAIEKMARRDEPRDRALREALLYAVHTLLNADLDQKRQSTWSLESWKLAARVWQDNVLHLLRQRGASEAQVTLFRDLKPFRRMNLPGIDEEHARLRDRLAERIDRLRTIVDKLEPQR
jgi:hypothetical protein